MVEPGGPQMTIWHMHFACWTHKATNAYLNYELLLLFLSNSGYMNTPQYYVICSLPLLFSICLLVGLILNSMHTSNLVKAHTSTSALWVPFFKLFYYTAICDYIKLFCSKEVFLFFF